MLFQNAQVLAVAGSLDPKKRALAQSVTAIPVTFALDPQEAELLTFADKNGSLQLVLRSPVDSRMQQTAPANWETLSHYIRNNQGVDLKAVAPKGKPSTDTDEETTDSTIEIYRGGRQ